MMYNIVPDIAYFCLKEIHKPIDVQHVLTCAYNSNSVELFPFSFCFGYLQCTIPYPNDIHLICESGCIGVCCVPFITMSIYVLYYLPLLLSPHQLVYLGTVIEFLVSSFCLGNFLRLCYKGMIFQFQCRALPSLIPTIASPQLNWMSMILALVFSLGTYLIL